MIIQMRNGDITSTVERNERGLRIFRVPKLNWEADTYSGIIDWNPADFCEPPVTQKLSDEDLRQAYAAPLNLPRYRNNSQSVERAVKLVSEACHEVYGLKNRHDLIISRQSARMERPVFETKRDFHRVGSPVELDSGH